MMGGCTSVRGATTNEGCTEGETQAGGVLGSWLDPPRQKTAAGLSVSVYIYFIAT